MKQFKAALAALADASDLIVGQGGMAAVDVADHVGVGFQHHVLVDQAGAGIACREVGEVPALGQPTQFDIQALLVVREERLEIRSNKEMYSSTTLLQDLFASFS